MVYNNNIYKFVIHYKGHNVLVHLVKEFVNLRKLVCVSANCFFCSSNNGKMRLT